MNERFGGDVLDESRGISLKGEFVTLHYDYIVSVVDGRCAAGFGINLQGFKDEDGKVWGLTSSSLDGFNMFAVEPFPCWQIIEPVDEDDPDEDVVLHFNVNAEALDGVETVGFDEFSGVFLVFKSADEAKSWVEKNKG